MDGQPVCDSKVGSEHGRNPSWTAVRERHLSAAQGCGLEDASESATHWDLIRDPAHVIKCYAPAIRRYFGVLIRNKDDADEATQEFFLRIVRDGFSRARQERGRFRDYLMKAVRNAASEFPPGSETPPSRREPLAGASPHGRSLARRGSRMAGRLAALSPEEGLSRPGRPRAADTGQPELHGPVRDRERSL